MHGGSYGPVAVGVVFAVASLVAMSLVRVTCRISYEASFRIAPCLAFSLPRRLSALEAHGQPMGCPLAFFR